MATFSISKNGGQEMYLINTITIKIVALCSTSCRETILTWIDAESAIKWMQRIRSQISHFSIRDVIHCTTFSLSLVFVVISSVEIATNRQYMTLSISKTLILAVFLMWGHSMAEKSVLLVGIYIFFSISIITFRKIGCS